MDLQLAQRTVLVTGASGGIGRAVAEAFAAEGARLVLHGRSNVDALREWKAEQPWAPDALVVEGDVREPADMERAVAAAVDAWGRLDICIANAGVWPSENQRLDEMDVDRFRTTVETNLLGAAWTARAFLAALACTGARDDGTGASIAFIGSTAGRFGERHHSDYAAAKAGLVGLMLSLKNEIPLLDPFGRANLVEPGWTVTHMARPALEVPGNIENAVRTMALRQIARAHDIAQCVLALSSPAMSRHITGQTITVAGGMEGRTLWNDEAIDVDAIRQRARE